MKHTYYLLITFGGDARIVKTNPAGTGYQGFVYKVEITIPTGWNRPPMGYIQLNLPEPLDPIIEVSDPLAPES